MMAAPERLNRFLARRGVGSRRSADELIRAGRVSVNGRPGAVGATVDPGVDLVSVDGESLEPRAPVVTVALNKPPGVVTTRHDPHGRATVIDLVEHRPGMVPVGRLDADSRGLLLLSTDGDLAHRLTHPRFGVRKRYRVTMRGRVSDGALDQMVAGVVLPDGLARALRVEPVAGSRGLVIEVTMGEGRRREVRRLCAAVAIDVGDLQRVAVGPVELGALVEGSSRRLSPMEERGLYRVAGLIGPRHLGGR